MTNNTKPTTQTPSLSQSNIIPKDNEEGIFVPLNQVYHSKQTYSGIVVGSLSFYILSLQIAFLNQIFCLSTEICDEKSINAIVSTLRSFAVSESERTRHIISLSLLF
jgi:hypothetical protein